MWNRDLEGRGFHKGGGVKGGPGRKDKLVQRPCGGRHEVHFGQRVKETRAPQLTV